MTPRNILIQRASRYALTAIVLLPLLARVVAIALTADNFGWPAYNYFIGYESGFGGRKLIGTICRLLLPAQHVHASHIQSIVIVGNVILLCMAAAFFSKSLSAANGGRHTVWLVALYLIGPFSLLEWFYTGMSVIFMETYQMSLIMLWLLLFPRHRKSNWFYLLTLFIAVVCILIHHTFCCTLFPVMVALLAYNLFEDNRPAPRRTLWTILIGAIVVLLLASIWLFSTMKIPEETLRSQLQDRVDIGVLTEDPFALKLLYYTSNSDNYIGNIHVLQHERYPQFVLSFLALFPLLLVLLYPLIYAARKAEASRRRYVIMCIVLMIIPLPIFLVATDYSRWFTGWLFCLTAADCTLLATHDIVVEKGVARLGAFFRHYYWVAILLVIWLASLHTLSFEGLEEAIQASRFISSH